MSFSDAPRFEYDVEGPHGRIAFGVSPPSNLSFEALDGCYAIRLGRRPTTAIGRSDFSFRLYKDDHLWTETSGSMDRWDDLRIGFCQGERPWGKLTRRSACRAADGGGECGETDATALVFKTVSAGLERFLFDLPSTENVRVLVHKWGTDDYPSPLQTRDGEIRIQGTVVDSRDHPVSGRFVYFRIEDPPDTAPYVVASHDAHPGDNVDGVGSFGGGGSTTTAVSGSDGRVSVTLQTTRFAAGDNYQVVASMTPGFACPGGCRRSAVYTAWKRVYLENDSMFRRGSFIAKVVPMGSRSIAVTDIAPFVGHEGSRIVLIHSGRWLFSTAYWMETHRLRTVVAGPNGGRGGELGLGDDDGQPSVTKFPYAPAPRVGGVVIPYLADGVGLVTGASIDPRKDTDGRDFFFADDRYLNELFGPAFVEYVAAPDPVPYVPHVESFRKDDDSMRSSFSRKWFANQGLPNRQHLVGASRELDPEGEDSRHRGVALAENGSSNVYLFVEALEKSAQGRNPVELTREITAAEVPHLWHVDPQTNGWRKEHDEERQWDRVWAKCQMAHTFICPTGVCPEFVDGHVAFHYVKRAGGVDSEYLWIRQRCEPIPLSYPDDGDDWWLRNGAGCR